MMIGYSKSYTHPIYARRKKHYCPKCNGVLSIIECKKLVDSKTPEAKKYDFGGEGHWLPRRTEFVWEEFKCESCGFQISIPAMRKLERAEKHKNLGRYQKKNKDKRTVPLCLTGEKHRSKIWLTVEGENMDEDFVRWHPPIEIEQKEYDVASIHYEGGECRIVLFDDPEKDKIEIFCEYVFVLNISPISGRMATIYNIQAKHNDRYYFSKWPFYEVKNSKLIRWLVADSQEVYQVEDFHHYVILTFDDFIEFVVSDVGPIVTIIGTK